jgi:putative phosphoribosyl transferase
MVSAGSALMSPPFRDRTEAGQFLATKLTAFKNRSDVLVLALPRGGVPVGFEVASAIQAPLDVFLVRKLGVPGHEELAFGAIATGGVRVLNHDLIRSLELSQDRVEAVVAREEAELQRREQTYRGGRPPPSPAGLIVILVDDGLATGSTMLAAVRALREGDPSKLVVAVPVAAPATCRQLRSQVDEIVCAATPEPFEAVGLWYDDFSQTTDEEVRDLLEQAARQRVN